VFDIHSQAVLDLAKAGAAAALLLAERIAKLESPRAIWILVPAAVVESTLDELAPLLAPDDAVIDSGQLVLARRQPPVAGSRQERNSLCRRRHLGRRLGPGARLLPDDWRRARHREKAGDEDVANKVLSALRVQFGGHEEKH
jgi:6-phosphogluconate dehydrogenase (decarboxylating)